MKSFLILSLVIALTKGQADNTCGCGCGCGYDPSPATSYPCQEVTTFPNGVDPKMSPFTGIYTSSQSIANEYDSRCSAFFPMCVPNQYLIVATTVGKDGSIEITTGIRTDMTGYPGAYELESTETNDGSCAANDFTLSGLNETCPATYVLYRCPNSDCTMYTSPTVLAFTSVLSPMNSCCQSAVQNLVQRQVGNMTLYPYSNTMPYKCVIQFGNQTAINAGYVNSQNAITINSDFSSYCNSCYS